MSWSNPSAVLPRFGPGGQGDRVVALVDVLEGGGFKGKDPARYVRDPDNGRKKAWVHARAGEVGHVVYVNEDGIPTVAWDASETATIVGTDEIAPSDVPASLAFVGPAQLCSWIPVEE